MSETRLGYTKQAQKPVCSSTLQTPLRVQDIMLPATRERPDFHETSILAWGVTQYTRPRGKLLKSGKSQRGKSSEERGQKSAWDGGRLNFRLNEHKKERPVKGDSRLWKKSKVLTKTGSQLARVFQGIGVG